MQLSTQLNTKYYHIKTNTKNIENIRNNNHIYIYISTRIKNLATNDFIGNINA